ncbi:MAG: hypothetical protein VX237_02365 [Chloroflexota bacterium]|nr:hypothetical protein [Chloroflexota bacterium]
MRVVNEHTEIVWMPERASYFANAINLLSPGSNWQSPSGDTVDEMYESMVWLDKTKKKPTKAQIKKKCDELAAAWKASEYLRKRQEEYPNFEECIHALLDGGNKLDVLQKKRQAIKKKYPKPE